THAGSRILRGIPDEFKFAVVLRLVVHHERFLVDLAAHADDIAPEDGGCLGRGDSLRCGHGVHPCGILPVGVGARLAGWIRCTAPERRTSAERRPAKRGWSEGRDAE